MRLVLQTFVTLDGVYQGPGSPEEDTSDGFTRGGWMVPHMDPTFMGIAAGWLERAGALLFGRRTYEAFSEAWPTMDDPDDPFAERMNRLPKYVASRTLTATPWQPATILDGDAVPAVAALKADDALDGELQIHGSGRLGRSMLTAGLVDEIRLVVSPTVLGQGRRLFADDGPALGLRVTEQQLTPGGLLILRFEATGPAAFATYERPSAV